MAHRNGATHPLDLHEALDRAMGEKEFLATLIEEFIAGLGEQLDGLRASISQQDRTTLVKLSHAVKGAAGNLSAKALAVAAQRLEAAGRTADFKTSAVLLDEMEKEVVRLRDYWVGIDWSYIN